MIKVLDAYALLAFLEKEPCYPIVQATLQEAAEDKTQLMMTTVNWGEIFYIIKREYGLQKAEETAALIKTFPMKLIDVDLALAKEAAIFKSSKNLSYADCFAAALAKTHKATLLTGDKEFKALESELKILWIN